jgi:hypothetical protein
MQQPNVEQYRTSTSLFAKFLIRYRSIEILPQTFQLIVDNPFLVIHTITRAPWITIF